MTALRMTSCPVCGSEIDSPSLETVVDVHGLTQMEASVLSAVWLAGGPAMTEAIFDAMYQDDPDGGPTLTNMYLALRRSLAGINAKLAVAGIWIEKAGYRQGYRLVIGGRRDVR
ncbi:hypothetical protein [Rhizobium sp. AB2/73]|uniref:hypothetical protein n=1 Tax=Rhizobium sp. AB2/73 TaxID=2795216 RepID=UPI0013B039AE|nr:hypothetical protein [Rhizobium sp. AB2/73]QYA11711.1 hypothetical protein J5284_14360 [Rhizobium sp. AB2/73]UEQ82359.1 hypothetical protein I8E17_07645 [Rhizobium sp. AB2/73]